MQEWALRFPVLSPRLLARQLEAVAALPEGTADSAAAWLLGGVGPAPQVLAQLLAHCPDPAVLLRLVGSFVPPAIEGPENPPEGALLRHLQGGWRLAGQAAPWFDPVGYEVLSARRRNPECAGLLHFLAEGVPRGLDPDPRRITRLSGLQNRCAVLLLRSADDRTAALAHVGRQLEGAGATGLCWLLIDASGQPAVPLPPGALAKAAEAGHLRIRPVAPGRSAADLAALPEVLFPGCTPLPLPPLPLRAPDAATPPLPAAPPVVRQRRAQLRAGAVAPRITLRCPAPDLARAPRWGDYHFAESLAAALRAQGAEASICLSDDWATPQDPAPDATLLLRGVRRCRPKPGPVNLMWMLSHPDKVEPDELLRYDHVFVASLIHAETLEPLLGSRVSALLQCSDPARFAPEAADPAQEAAVPAHPLLFVGNSRRAERWVVSAALSQGHDLAVYGAEWQGTAAEPHVLAENIANTELGAYYRRAGIVLNDHWPDMAQKGFVSNRLFDVAMAGGFVISDSFEGAGMFMGQLVQVADAAALDAALRHFAQAPQDRAARAAALHRLVRREHSFAQRAGVILSRLRALF